MTVRRFALAMVVGLSVAAPAVPAQPFPAVAPGDHRSCTFTHAMPAYIIFEVEPVMSLAWPPSSKAPEETGGATMGVGVAVAEVAGGVGVTVVEVEPGAGMMRR